MRNALAFVVAVCAALSLGACGPQKPQGAPLLPAGVGAAPGQTVNGAAVKVYLDGSLSMAGYIRGASGQAKALGDVITLMDSFAASRKLPLQYSAFGKVITPLPNPTAARRYATVSAYECKQCDNLESRIDTVLEEIKRADKRALNVVVTDLWLDNKSFVASKKLALGLPLTEMLRQGRAIGVIGVRAPFDGTIYDLPSGHDHRYVGDHPLFVLLIGPEAEVARAYAALTGVGSPAFAPNLTHYSLFSTQPGEAWRPLRRSTATGGGVIPDAAVKPGLLPTWLGQYTMRMSTAKTQGGEVATVIDPALGVGPGAVWAGPGFVADRVWRLSSEKALAARAPDAWSPIGALQNAWSTSPRTPAATLRLTAKTAVDLPPGVYLVAGYVGTKAVDAPNPANSWMRDWSFGPAQETEQLRPGASMFRTLNLADIPDLMEAAINGAAPNGRVLAASGFVVKIER